MPGRGRPWRGVGQGNQDRIGSGAIADGSITEADLDSALQAKVNAGGGGGNTEVLLDSVVPDNLTSHSFNLSRSVAMDGSDIAKLIVSIQNIKLSTTDRIIVQFNSVGSAGNITGIVSDGTTVSAFKDTSDISSIIEIPFTSVGYVDLEIEGKTSGGEGEGFLRATEQGFFGSGGFTLTTNSFDPITSVQIASKGGSATINTPTRVVVLAINKD